MAVGPAIVVGGVLLLLAKSLGKKTPDPTPQPMPGGDNTYPVTPKTVDNTSRDVSIATSVVGTAIGAATKILQSIGTGGGIATASAQSAAASAASTAVAGAYTAGAGGLVIGAIILIAIIATNLALGISANITNKHFYEERVLTDNTNPVMFATTLFSQLIGRVSKWLLPDGRPLPDGWSTANGVFRIALSPEEQRMAALAALYVATWVAQAKNDALVKYYQFMHWTPEQMANTPVMQSIPAGNAVPGADFFASVAANPLALKTVMASARQDLQARSPANVSGDVLWNKVTAPFTVDEMRTAATQVFGADLPKVEAAMRFTGAAKAVFLASIEGYGAEGGGWGAWIETLGSIFGWTPVGHTSSGPVPYWVTNASPPVMLNTWWLIDPATGNRIAPLETHSDNVLRISIKGAAMPGMPGMFAGYGAYAGECTDADGSLIACGTPYSTGTRATLSPGFVPGDPIMHPRVAAAIAASQPKSSGMLLPALVIGGMLLLKSGAVPGFGGMRRSRRRRR